MTIYASLPVGRYRAHSTLDALQAAINGMFSGEAEAVCRIERGHPWIIFYRDGEMIFECNALYGAANFTFEPIKDKP